MLKNLFTFLCESSSVDGTDGKLSAYKLFEEFNIPEGQDEQVNKGAILEFKFDLVSGWVMDDPSSRTINLTTTKRIINHAGEKLAESANNLELPPNQTRFNIRENITGLPIKGFGDYIFELTISEKGKTIGKVEYPFRVHSGAVNRS